MNGVNGESVSWAEMKSEEQLKSLVFSERKFIFLDTSQMQLGIFLGRPLGNCGLIKSTDLLHKKVNSLSLRRSPEQFFTMSHRTTENHYN